MVKRKKPWRSKRREWYEDELDIRKGERLTETLIEAFSGPAVGTFSMKPFGVERYLASQTRRQAYAKKDRIRRKVRQCLLYLQKAEFITETNGEYRLTVKGWLKYLSTYSRAMKKIKKKSKESKQWLIVIFDIPEELRSFRDSLRRSLYALGFEQFQKSVFVTHDPGRFEIVSKILAQTELYDRVKLIVGERIL